MAIKTNVATTLSCVFFVAISPAPLLSKINTTRWPATKQTRISIWLDEFYQVFFLDQLEWTPGGGLK